MNRDLATADLSSRDLTKRFNVYLNFTVTCRTNSLVYKRKLTSRQEEYIKKKKLEEAKEKKEAEEKAEENFQRVLSHIKEETQNSYNNEMDQWEYFEFDTFTWKYQLHNIKKYEFPYDVSKSKDKMILLNIFGNEGWELIKEEKLDIGENDISFLFKRKKLNLLTNEKKHCIDSIHLTIS